MPDRLLLVATADRARIMMHPVIPVIRDGMTATRPTVLLHILAKTETLLLSLFTASHHNPAWQLVKSYLLFLSLMQSFSLDYIIIVACLWNIFRFDKSYEMTKNKWRLKSLFSSLTNVYVFSFTHVYTTNMFSFIINIFSLQSLQHRLIIDKVHIFQAFYVRTYFEKEARHVIICRKLER